MGSMAFGLRLGEIISNQLRNKGYVATLNDCNNFCFQIYIERNGMWHYLNGMLQENNSIKLNVFNPAYNRVIKEVSYGMNYPLLSEKMLDEAVEKSIAFVITELG